MNSIKITIQNDMCDKEIKYVLRRHMSVSANLLKKLKKEKSIKLNGKDATVVEICRKGDILEIIMPRENSEGIVPVDIPLDIIYEDDSILAVNKPKDMPTHPSIGNFYNTLGNAVMYYFKDTPFTFRPVNRLDRDTTGIVIIAKDARVSAILSKQMQYGIFQKTYYAITEGIPTSPLGEINVPIARETDSIIKRTVREDGQEAITRYEIIDTLDNKALLKINLLTGRTHQIRVHMAYIGTPLLYDYMYGTEIQGETLYLHCGEIRFNHPQTNSPITLSVKPKFPFFNI